MRWMNFGVVLALAVFVHATGCVYSHYDITTVRFVDESARETIGSLAREVTGEGLDNDHGRYYLEEPFLPPLTENWTACATNGCGAYILEYVYVKRDCSIFYPPDFEFFPFHSDGDILWPFKEMFFHLPTLIIELPVFILGSSHRVVPVILGRRGDPGMPHGLKMWRVDIWDWKEKRSLRSIRISDGLGNGGRIEGTLLILEKKDPGDYSSHYEMTWRCARDGIPQDISLGKGSLSDRLYFTSSGECYLFPQKNSQYCLSFLGVHADDSIPFMWRIDLETGQRECVRLFDRWKTLPVLQGKIIPPPDTEQTDSKGNHQTDN